MPRKPWETEEDQYLIDHSQAKTHRQIAVDLNRTEKSIALRALHLAKEGVMNLRTRPDNPSWSDVEDHFLISNYTLLNTTQLMAALKKSRNIVSKRAKELGLTVTRSNTVRIGKIEQCLCHNVNCNIIFSVYMTPNETKSSKYCSNECSRTDCIESPSKAILQNLYIKQQKPVSELTSQFEVCSTTIYKWLKQFNIRIRNDREARLVFWASDQEQKNVEAHSESRVGIPIESAGNKNLVFRSSWESNIALWLDHMGYRWSYEPKRFVFNEIAKGIRSYLPDFYVADLIHPVTLKPGVWIEIKGFFRKGDLTRLKRFQKYYPEEFKQFVGITGNRTNLTHAKFLSLGIPVIRTLKELQNEYKDSINEWKNCAI